MRKVGLIASREFVAAVTNKGFVIGLLLMPALIAMAAIALPRLMTARAAPVRGQIAVIDYTGQVLPALRLSIAPEAFARRRADTTRRALTSLPPAARDAAVGSGDAIDRTLGPPPEIHLDERPPGPDLAAAKAWLTENDAAARHLALVVVHPNAVTQADAPDEPAAYDLFVPSNLDERVEDLVFESLREAIVGARLRARHLNQGQFDVMMRVGRATSVTVTKDNERRTNQNFNRLLPFVFAGLLLFAILIGGQTLLTQTVEEKSSRVIEVLLSAVSPIELMAGKILGQMAVSLLVLAIYLAMGLMLMMSFAVLGLLDPWLIGYLVLFFLIAYLVFAAIFGAIGAAVNEMREAQALMTPVVLILMAPWMFAPAIARDPNATFSVALSLIPPVNTFAMLIRLASTTPPPAWQTGLSIAIGIGSAYVAVWFAAKIFKVGLLMHGKAPDFATLIRWARAA